MKILKRELKEQKNDVKGGYLMNTKDKIALVDNEHELEKILTAKNRVIALCYASWCPYCARLLPIFEKRAEGEGRNFLLVRDDQESMGDKYAVKVVPTVLFFEKGEVSKRLDGVPGVGITEKQLVDFIAVCTEQER
jgi:thioredoxin 1